MYVEERKEGEAQVTEPSWEDFLVWVADKDPNEGYVWASPWKCAAGQYVTARGISLLHHEALYQQISRAAAQAYPRTFGSLQEMLNVQSRSGRTNVRPNALANLRNVLASVFG